MSNDLFSRFLKSPCLTPFPVMLRGYVARLRRQGGVEVVKTRLVAARAAVEAGCTLFEAIADGSLDAWKVREFLGGVLSQPMVTWDERQGRTQLERLAVIDRALAEIAVLEVGEAQVRRNVELDHDDALSAVNTFSHA